MIKARWIILPALLMGSLFWSGSNTTVYSAHPSPLVSPYTWLWNTMPDYPLSITDNAVVAHDGYIYSFSGISGGPGTNRSYRFDGTTWTEIASLPESRANARAVSDGTYIYIVNGYDSLDIASASIYRYDVVANTYTSLEPPPTATAAHALAILNGVIYRIGGCLDAACTQVTNSVEAYDITNNIWQAVADYPLSTAFLMSVSYGTYVYTAGGGYPSETTNKTYRFDGANWEDAVINDLPIARFAAASDVIDGVWLLAGGVVDVQVPSTSVIALDLDTQDDSWIDHAPLLQAEYRLGGATLNEAFCTVGGRSTSGSLGTHNTQCFKQALYANLLPILMYRQP